MPSLRTQVLRFRAISVYELAMILRYFLLISLLSSTACSSEDSPGSADASASGDAGIAIDGAVVECEEPKFAPSTLLAEHGAGALGVTIAADITYWANRNVGEVWQVAPPAAAVLVATGQDGPTDVAVSADHIYWSVSGGVMRRAIAGGEPIAFATGQAGTDGIAVDEQAVYWVNRDSGQVMKQALAGGAAIELANNQDGPLDIVLSDTTVYWTNFGKSVMSVDKSGGPVVVAAGDQPGASGLAIDATHLYWAARGRLVDGTLVPGFVSRMPLTGGEPTLLFTAESFESPSEVAVHGEFLYWAQMGGDVWRSALDGKCAGKLSENADGANGIAVGDQGVFFTTLNTGALSSTPL